MPIEINPEDPGYLQSAHRFQNRLERNTFRTMRTMTQTWETVERELADRMTAAAERTIEIARQNDYGEVPMWRLAQDRRYAALLNQIDQEIGKYVYRSQGDIQRNGREAAQLGIEAAQATIEELAAGTRFQGTLGVDFDQLNTRQAEQIKAISGPYSQLGKILSSISPLSATGATEALIAGVAQGKNGRAIAKDMRDRMRIGFNRSLLIARDQVNRSFRDNQRQAYSTVPQIQGYKRLAAKNARTCLACIALDGTFYKVNEFMAVHPQDRCTMIPILAGLPPPEWEEGPQWLRSQPEAVQRKVMGNGRFDLWQKAGGQTHLIKDFARIDPNYEWGPSAQIQTLKAMRLKWDIQKDVKGKPAAKQEPEAKQDKRTQEAAQVRAKLIATKATDKAENDRLRELWHKANEDYEAKAEESYDFYEAKRDEGLEFGEIHKLPEWIVIERQKENLLKANLAARDKALGHEKAARERRRAMVQLPEDQRSTFKVKIQGGLAKDRRAIWEEGIERFRSLVPKGLMDETTVPMWVRSGKRAKQLRIGGGQRSCQYRGEIFMGNTADSSVMTHELGHALENAADFVLARTVAYYNERTKGETLQDLADLSPGYKRGVEFTKPDKWMGYTPHDGITSGELSKRRRLGAYTGKFYGRQVYDYEARGYRTTGDMLASEIVSMGIEEMAKDPLWLAEADPDLFDFIYDIRFIKRPS